MKNIGEMFELGHGRGNNAILPPDGVMMANQSAGNGRRAITIAISKGVMDACRYVTGDRATVDMDCVKSEITVRRVLPTDKTVISWMLSARSGNKNSPKGQRAAATMKITATPIMMQAFGMEDAKTPYIPSPVITGPEGITFPMRKPWTVVSQVTK